MTKTIYDYTLNHIDGNPRSLKDYAGKILLIVNVASKCGLTPQYEGLEALYKKYKSQGLEVLGFPANEFLSQEPGSNEEIQNFCRSNFGVDFPMFEKIIVKGPGQHPLYRHLTETLPEGVQKPEGTLMGRLKSKNLLTGSAQDIKWNFEKFLIDKNGRPVQRFSPELEPQDPIILKAIDDLLAQ